MKGKTTLRLEIPIAWETSFTNKKYECVPGCNLCCSSEFEVKLAKEKIRNKRVLRNVDKDSSLKAQHGYCSFLKKGKCEIQSQKPFSCISFPYRIGVTGDGNLKIDINHVCPGVKEGQEDSGLKRLIKRFTQDFTLELGDEITNYKTSVNILKEDYETNTSKLEKQVLGSVENGFKKQDFYRETVSFFQEKVREKKPTLESLLENILEVGIDVFEYKKDNTWEKQPVMKIGENMVCLDEVYPQKEVENVEMSQEAKKLAEDFCLEVSKRSTSSRHYVESLKIAYQNQKRADPYVSLAMIHCLAPMYLYFVSKTLSISQGETTVSLETMLKTTQSYDYTFF